MRSLEFCNVSKIYKSEDVETVALSDVSWGNNDHREYRLTVIKDLNGRRYGRKQRILRQGTGRCAACQ